MTSKIKEAWTGPGKKDEVITEFEPKFDALHIDMNRRGNTEWWYFDARLDNGYVVVAFFRAKHERTGKTGVEITIYTPDGEKIQNVYDYSRTDLKVSRENANVQVGSNYIKVDNANPKLPNYEIFIDEGKYGIHLKYTPKVQAWMPGRGKIEFGKMEHFGWCVAIPRAKVEGTIKVNGETITVNGEGYHDHNWVTVNLMKIVDYWHWGRIFSENFTMLYAYIKCNKKMDDYAIKVLMLAKGESVFLSTGEYELIEKNHIFNGDANNEYPKILEFVISDNKKIILEVQDIIDADNLLLELNPIVRFLAKNVLGLKPGYFRLNSKFDLDIAYNGNKFKEQGNTLHEMVIVRQVKK